MRYIWAGIDMSREFHRLSTAFSRLYCLVRVDTGLRPMCRETMLFWSARPKCGIYDRESEARTELNVWFQ